MLLYIIKINDLFIYGNRENGCPIVFPDQYKAMSFIELNDLTGWVQKITAFELIETFDSEQEVYYCNDLMLEVDEFQIYTLEELNKCSLISTMAH